MVTSFSHLNSIHFFQSLTAANSVYPRRLLLLNTPIPNLPVDGNPTSAAAPPPLLSTTRAPSMSGSSSSNFDSNVIMILAVLLCALICALGLNSIVRCALRCSAARVTLEHPFRRARRDTGGVKKKALRSLPTLTYSDGLELPGASSECAICLSEFGVGERVRVLPKCNHGFHVQCIDRWLAAHSSCPTCRQCLSSDSRKTAAGCAPVAFSSLLSPLDPEDPLFNYRGRY